MGFENSLHYNHLGEGSAVDKAAEYVDSLIIPAHFAAFHADTIAGRVSNLDQEYYIDPHLPEFRIGDNFLTDSGDLSPWSDALAESYGSVVTDPLQERGNLRYSELSRDNQREIAELTVDFQLNILDEHADSTLARYELEDVDHDLLPKAVVPWYIKLCSGGELEQNKQVISDTAEYTDHPIKPCFFIERPLIADAEFRERIARYLDDTPVTEVFLWVEGLGKRDSKAGHYVHITDLVDRIADQGVAPHFLYGNYLSNLLAFFGLRGTGFGINYSESSSEKVESTDGGGGNERYYFDPIKEFVGIAEAVQLGERGGELCDCGTCEHWMEDWIGIYAVADEQKRLARHYAAKRHQQRMEIQENSLRELLQELEENYKEYSEGLKESGTVVTADHLNEWKRGIELYAENIANTAIAGLDSF